MKTSTTTSKTEVEQQKSNWNKNNSNEKCKARTTLPGTWTSACGGNCLWAKTIPELISAILDKLLLLKDIQDLGAYASAATWAMEEHFGWELCEPKRRYKQDLKRYPIGERSSLAETFIDIENPNPSPGNSDSSVVCRHFVSHQRHNFHPRPCIKFCWWHVFSLAMSAPVSNSQGMTEVRVQLGGEDSAPFLHTSPHLSRYCSWQTCD